MNIFCCLLNSLILVSHSISLCCCRSASLSVINLFLRSKSACSFASLLSNSFSLLLSCASAASCFCCCRFRIKSFCSCCLNASSCLLSSYCASLSAWICLISSQYAVFDSSSCLSFSKILALTWLASSKLVHF